ncbi:T-cell immunoglobulin and mucin domain-containing protein 4 isoform X2 [Microcaecilia unicolor]|uniref:T-cell immunoglobulin and mucin domain-containing protein 4-like isoform X2 n=1 Tax=Microcaecilia unicolor TaxID=1415580 RepID=UPI00118478FB|nr:T-cell immunoglobulin and mucin domain-containing protein 4-like isoform X2 [Microcaecilia unicolor]
MSHSALLLWSFTLLCIGQMVLTLTVRGVVGSPVTLPCRYNVRSESDITTMCWGRGSCPNSKCNDEILHTDGRKVISKTSSRYQLTGVIVKGDVSLTIENATEGDRGSYCCRVEIHGWFNDLKFNIQLEMYRALTTPPTTIRSTTLTTRAVTETTFPTLPVEMVTETAVTGVFTTNMESNFISTDALTTEHTTLPTPPMRSTTEAIRNTITQLAFTTLLIQTSTDSVKTDLFSTATETIATVTVNNFTSTATDALTTGFQSESTTMISKIPLEVEQKASASISKKTLIIIICLTVAFCFLGLLLAFKAKVWTPLDSLRISSMRCRRQEGQKRTFIIYNSQADF